MIIKVVVGLQSFPPPHPPSIIPGEYHFPAHLAHDVGEDGSRGSYQRAHHRHQVVVEHEALGAQGPARVRVEHGDHHGHVSAWRRTGDGHTRVTVGHDMSQRYPEAIGHRACRTRRRIINTVVLLVTAFKDLRFSVRPRAAEENKTIT